MGDLEEETCYGSYVEAVHIIIRRCSLVTLSSVTYARQQVMCMACQHDPAKQRKSFFLHSLRPSLVLTLIPLTIHLLDSEAGFYKIYPRGEEAMGRLDHLYYIKEAT